MASPSGLSISRLPSRLLAWLPEGHDIPEDAWARRHRGIQIILVAHAVGLFGFAVARGSSVLHSALECSLVLASALAAGWPRASRGVRSGIATFGLVSSSALLVHFSGGTIEAHFHFFAMIAIITLYQSWTPYLLALGFVVLHHGAASIADPSSVYNHPAAIANPWRWALIHGLAVLFASVANMVAWRLNEQASEHAQLILDSAREGIFGIDLNGTITFVNPSAAKMLGYPASALLGADAHTLLRSGPDAVCVDDDSSSIGEAEFVSASGVTFPVEYARMPIFAQGRLTGRVVSFRDITEHKRVYDELQQNISLVTATLESTADGILVVDRHGRITSLNKKFADMWRIPKDVLDSKDDERAISYVLSQLEDPGGFFSKVQELYAHPEAESFDELHFLDGRTFERYSKPQTVDGESVGRVWSFRDVTEQRRLDEMKNEFLSAVAHELRTPLTSVLGFALTLERMSDDLSESDRADLMSRLSKSARKLQRLLGDTMDLDRVSRGIVEPHRAPTDLRALVERIIEESEPLHSGRAITVEGEPVVASVDAAKVERIVDNLLINAIRHTAADAPIDVSVSTTPDGALIVVADRGAGVPDDLKSKIFEPFRQGPVLVRHAPGVGIGLSLVKRFSELHGGRAWVEDRPGGGSAFHVLLPSDAARPRNRTPAA